MTAASWWSRRFVDVLESYGLGSRMQRGRRYARAGQVLSFDVQAGEDVKTVSEQRLVTRLGSVVDESLFAMARALRFLLDL